MDDLDEFWVHETTVRTHERSGPFGEEYADPAVVRCFIDHTRQLVRDAQGREVTSEATIRGPVGQGMRFTPESRTTVGGRERIVLSLAIRDGGPLDMPDHFEATTS